jgi:hypothetical protein
MQRKPISSDHRHVLNAECCTAARSSMESLSNLIFLAERTDDHAQTRNYLSMARDIIGNLRKLLEDAA